MFLMIKKVQKSQFMHYKSPYLRNEITMWKEIGDRSQRTSSGVPHPLLTHHPT